MEQFGCCHLYRECSNAGSCLQRGGPEFAGCQYRQNLEAGRNFYRTMPAETVLFTVQIGSRSFETGKDCRGRWFSRAIELPVPEIAQQSNPVRYEQISIFELIGG